MIKNIYFEKINNKNSYYLSDHALDDPSQLTLKNLKKFKKKVIIKYHWDDSNKLNSDYKYLKKFVNQKYQEIASKLNAYHSINMSTKYWKIIIYPWLMTITNILYDRWEIIRSLRNKKKIFI